MLKETTSDDVFATSLMCGLAEMMIEELASGKFESVLPKPDVKSPANLIWHMTVNGIAYGFIKGTDLVMGEGVRP